MSRSRRAVLLADIGGTNARVALLSGGTIKTTDVFSASQFRAFDDVLEIVRGKYSSDYLITDAFLAAAGPVADGRCTLTNSPWVIDAAHLRDAHDFESVCLINDFEAAAWGVPMLSPADLCAVGGGRAETGKPQVVLGPGTGFGMACRIPSPGDALVLVTEGGHATLPSMSPREDAILDILRAKFGHVSAERALSGGGLQNLYAAVAELDGISVPARSAAQIIAAALPRTCSVSASALDLFLAFLGSVAGNAALTFGARGGVYIAGGIVPRIVDCVARSELRTRFEAKGRFRAYLESIPLQIILSPHPAILGLMLLAQSRQSSPSPGTSSDPDTRSERRNRLQSN